MVAEPLQHERKLVASEPRDAVGRAERGAKALAHLDQQAVAECVALGVVDAAEVVEIDDHQRRHAPVATQPVDRVTAAIEEESAIRQLGQRVVEGELRDRRDRPLEPLRHAVEVGAEPAELVRPLGRRARGEVLAAEQVGGAPQIGNGGRDGPIESAAAEHGDRDGECKPSGGHAGERDQARPAQVDREQGDAARGHDRNEKHEQADHEPQARGQ